jgi:hypothetical protein
MRSGAQISENNRSRGDQGPHGQAERPFITDSSGAPKTILYHCKGELANCSLHGPGDGGNTAYYTAVIGGKVAGTNS